MFMSDKDFPSSSSVADIESTKFGKYYLVVVNIFLQPTFIME